MTTAYGISIAYLVGDCGYEGYKAHLEHRNALRAGTPPSELPSETTDVGLRVAKRAVFQGVATMLLPAFTIHTAVKQSAKRFWSHRSNVRLRAWGPTLTGLSIVPALPYMFDEPIEHVVDYAWQHVDAFARPGAAAPRSKLAHKEL